MAKKEQGRPLKYGVKTKMFKKQVPIDLYYIFVEMLEKRLKK